jgi:hypothetical protein
VTAVLLASLLALPGCDASSVRRPLLSNPAVSTAIQQFKDSTIVPSEPLRDALVRESNAPAAREWNAQLLVAQPPAKVKVSGRAFMSVIEVAYNDGLDKYPAFKSADYTSVYDVRVKGSTLFVYRSVSLIWTEYRLAVFDLATRMAVADYLVSPDDMPSTPP